MLVAAVVFAVLAARGERLSVFVVSVVLFVATVVLTTVLAVRWIKRRIFMVVAIAAVLTVMVGSLLPATGAVLRCRLISPGADLTNCDLAGRDLAGRDLSGVNLAGSDLADASLAGANLSDANLDRTTLQRSDLDRAGLENASLREAKLSGATLTDVSAAGADFTGADLRDAELRAADLSGATLDRARVERNDISGAGLEDASLRGTSLSGATLTEVSASGADLTDADLAEADLDGADLAGARLARADLRSASMAGATLTDGSLEFAVLDGAVLTEARLDGVDANRVDAQRADFRSARLQDADLSDATLNASTLDRVDLAGADLTNASLRTARLRSANLNGSDLTSADLGNADLTRANLRGTTLRSTDLNGASGVTDAMLIAALGTDRVGLTAAVARARLRFDDPHVIASVVSGVDRQGGVAGVRPYRPSAGFHPVVVLDGGFETELARQVDRARGTWAPAGIRFTELVVVEETGREVVEACPYSFTLGGPLAVTITRYRHTADVSVLAAATGRVVAEHTFQGSLPRPCRFRELETTESLFGSGVRYKRDVIPWLARIVRPVNAKTASNPTATSTAPTPPPAPEPPDVPGLPQVPTPPTMPSPSAPDTPISGKVLSTGSGRLAIVGISFTNRDPENCQPSDRDGPTCLTSKGNRIVVVELGAARGQVAEQTMRGIGPEAFQSEVEDETGARTPLKVIGATHGASTLRLTYAYLDAKNPASLTLHWPENPPISLLGD